LHAKRISTCKITTFFLIIRYFLCKFVQMKLSIVIPVYRVEATLDRCMESIVNQTFTDFEVILVDDGSWLSGKVRRLGTARPSRQGHPSGERRTEQRPKHRHRRRHGRHHHFR